MVKTGAAAEAAAPAAAASVLISCFIFIFYFGFSFDLILIFAFFFANTGIYTSHCTNDMFVHVTVQGCAADAPDPDPSTSKAGSVGANAASLLLVFAAMVVQHFV